MCGIAGNLNSRVSLQEGERVKSSKGQEAAEDYRGWARSKRSKAECQLKAPSALRASIIQK